MKISEFWSFLVAHAFAVAIVLAAIAVVVSRFIWWIQKNYPVDRTANGITVGQAKVFDNRSLALRVERLSAGLETLKVVNQNITENISALQGSTSSESTQTLSLAVKATGKSADQADVKTASAKEEKSGGAASGDSKRDDSSPKTGLAAGDLLNDQLNLASQIFNLQLLYERSLSDRLIGGVSRLQAVLGFQVSITPPAGYKDCIAVAEIEVRMNPPVPAGEGIAAGPQPVSLVALMPQEKTYNAESVSTSERSIGGSAVARVLNLNFNSKSGTKQLFIHRDSDTVAFEREPDASGGSIVFGWEFRPVLGRRTVSAGTRQMLAVVAIPVADNEVAGDPVLEVKARSYWRKYNPKVQTSSPNWSWLPWRVDRSARRESQPQMLPVPSTARIQSALAPSVTGISWVNSGKAKATVIVKGKNFFSGTKVVMGGEVHKEEDGSITLKSDQALEFETTIDSLTTGDAVLSGRFGPALQLGIPKAVLPVASLGINRATIYPLRKSRAVRIRIDIAAYTFQGDVILLTLAELQKLPDPILFIGNEPVAMPYDYIERSSTQPPTPDDPTSISVEAWIPSQSLSKSSSVSFRVPFCGFDFQTSQPLSFADPAVTRMGQDDINTVFRIFYPQGFGTSNATTSLSIDLDKTYTDLVVFPGVVPNLVRMTDTEYRFTVANNILAQYQNMVVRIGSGEPFLLPIPPAEKIPAKPTVDRTTKTPEVTKAKHGPVEWVGSALDTITDVNWLQPSATGQPVPVPQQFTTYAGGTRLLVYLAAGSTDGEGKIILECTTATGEKLTLPVFVVS